MLASMTWKQLREWMAFDALEPFGPIRADHHAAYIVATILNVNKKRGSKRLSSNDVLQLFGDSVKARKAPMDWRHMKALAQMTAAAYNAEHDRAQARRAGRPRPRQAR